MNTNDAFKQMRLGKGHDRKKWTTQVEDKTMINGLWAKFSKEGPHRERLLATGNSYLAEHTPHPSWGIGFVAGNIKAVGYRSLWLGDNKLGHALMQVRDDLRSGKVKPSSFSISLDKTIGDKSLRIEPDDHDHIVVVKAVSPPGSPPGYIKCHICQAVVKSRNALSSHLKKVHPLEHIPRLKKTKPSEEVVKPQPAQDENPDSIVNSILDNLIKETVIVSDKVQKCQGITKEFGLHMNYSKSTLSSSATPNGDTQRESVSMSYTTDVDTTQYVHDSSEEGASHLTINGSVNQSISEMRCSLLRTIIYIHFSFW